MLAFEKIPLTDDCREFTSAFQHAAIGMALVSPEGRFIQVNRALCRILGYSETELLATDFQSITLESDLEIDLAQVSRLLRGDIESYQIEKRYLHKKGHTVRAQLSVSLIRDDQGLPLYFISQIQDCSPRARTMEELRLCTAQLNTLIDHLPLGVLLTDEHRSIRLANQRLCDFLQLPLSPAKLENRDSISFIEDFSYLLARPEFALNRVNEIVSNRRPVHAETLEMADGRELRRDYIPVFVDGDYRGSLWMFRDVTAEKRRW